MKKEYNFPKIKYPFLYKYRVKLMMLINIIKGKIQIKKYKIIDKATKNINFSKELSNIISLVNNRMNLLWQENFTKSRYLIIEEQAARKIEKEIKIYNEENTKVIKNINPVLRYLFSIKSNNSDIQNYFRVPVVLNSDVFGETTKLKMIVLGDNLLYIEKRGENNNEMNEITISLADKKQNDYMEIIEVDNKTLELIK